MGISIEELNSMQIDVLREIGNIGAGNAATALSKMISKRIDMDVPKINILEFKNVAELVGGPETEVIGIYFKVNGDITGSIMVIIDKKSAKKLTNLLMDRNNEEDDLDEMDLSALRRLAIYYQVLFIILINTNKSEPDSIGAVSGTRYGRGNNKRTCYTLRAGW